MKIASDIKRGDWVEITYVSGAASLGWFEGEYLAMGMDQGFNIYTAEIITYDVPMVAFTDDRNRRLAHRKSDIAKITKTN